ncbi:MAG TPA: serine/threonine-protein kinase, partial [Planctomycetota bacterium]|nr:serine/threonine-protein kinase [Planctomycetota bacterium]
QSAAVTDLASQLPDWEAFYRSYKLPGYVPGFQITSKLGGGMFGLVFKASKQSIGKDYAIKFLKVDDGEVRRAVLLELEQVKYFAQVDHPNLVSIEDRGEVDGIPYIVMAYAGAGTLKDRLPGKPEEREELVRYFAQACRGVAALHERSLVHFDLKPANVFLKGSVARVGDYGLSKLVTHSRGSLSMGRGTPYYMAPEMLQRRGDARSDVYSLGVMLYEILCGDVPFKGDSEWEVLRKHEKEAPAFPPEVSARERAVLARCLQKDPAQRFQSVHELMAALGAESAVGAATWQDVRAGAGQHGEPAGAGGATAPGPAGGADLEDAYADLRRAAREAATSGAKIGREAWQNAAKAARQATKEANKAMREAWLQARAKWRGWSDEQRQSRRAERQARRAARKQRRAQRAIDRAAARQQRYEQRMARRRRLRPLGVLITVGLVVFGLFNWVTLAAPESETITTATASGPLQVQVVPPQFDHLVSRKEGAWSARRTQADRARTLLQLQEQRFLDGVPLSQEARRATAAWPMFGPAPLEVTGEVQRRLNAQLQQLEDGQDYDQQLAQTLAAAGRPALLLAVQRLEAVTPEVAVPSGRSKAEHLLRFLQLTTGNDKIVLVGDPEQPAFFLQDNQHVATLWRWWLNEFAPTPAAWKAYGKLHGR